MATVSFHFKEPNGEKPKAIFIWFNPKKERNRIHTGNKIRPNQWEGGDEQRAETPRLSAETHRNKTINANNERMRNQLLDYWQECQAAGTLPTNEQLRAVVEPETSAAPAPERPRPLPDFTTYLERMVKKNSPNTVRSHRTC